MKSERLSIEIETERLTLRSLESEDISEDYVAWLNDPEINQYISTSHKKYTKESCRFYVKSFQNRNDKALVGIFTQENRIHIGNLTFSTIDWHHQSAAIGISIGKKEYMGHGFGKEALNGLVKYGIQQLKLIRLYAGINVNNVNSLKLFVSCGFKIEGLLRKSNKINDQFEDSYIVAILASEL